MEKIEYCHDSDAGYIKFPSEEAARAEIGGTKLGEMKVWKCAGCGSWHMVLVEQSSKVPKDVEISIREIFICLTNMGCKPMGSGKDGILLEGLGKGKLKLDPVSVAQLLIKAGTLMTGPGYLIPETSRNPSKDVIGFYRRFPARKDI